MSIILDGFEETCDFHFEDYAGQFFNNQFTGNDKNPILDHIETVAL